MNILIRIKTDSFLFFLFFLLFSATESESDVTYSEFVLCI